MVYNGSAKNGAIRKISRTGLNILGMQTPRDRLIFFGIIPFIMFAVSHLSFMPRISLYANLGIDSPSIGLTRAFWKLTSGDFMGAWKQNLLIYPVVIITISVIFKDLLTVLQRSTKKR